METLKCSYKKVKDTDEGQFLMDLTEYLPPSFFGTLVCDPDIKQEIVDMWENISSDVEDVKHETVQKLCTLCQNHPKYMIHFVARITSQLDDADSRLVWESMAQSINHLGDVQKNQIGHFLLSKLIIQNREKSFAPNYDMLQTAFHFCDWNLIQKQAFQKSFGVGGENFPDFTLAFNTQNEEATRFFLRTLPQQVAKHSNNPKNQAIYKNIIGKIINKNILYADEIQFINTLSLNPTAIHELNLLYKNL